MSLTDRCPKLATVKRITSTGDDGAGGRTRSEETILTGYQFGVGRHRAHRRQETMQEWGLTEAEALRLFTGWGPPAELQVGDMLEVSESERYRVVGHDPQLGLRGRQDHSSFTLVLEECQWLP